RLCVTVEIPPHGEPQFYRSVIRSDARLTYGQAQRREAAPEILAALALNDELANGLRARRFARGALQVQTPEVVFRFDGNGGVADAWLESEPHAHVLVEELMIRANELVAELLASRNRPALYRVHERPDPQAVEHLLEYLADEICLAWLLEQRLFERGWDEPWDGEIVGVIGSGIFVRFGEVFEGFVPARRLHGEFFEINPLGTALVGRTTGRRFRLGD